MVPDDSSGQFSATLTLSYYEHYWDFQFQKPETLNADIAPVIDVPTEKSSEASQEMQN